jgi:hypothetical protein
VPETGVAYWPFESASAQPATEPRGPEIDFLETAYNEGFAPFKMPVSDFGATAPSGRRGFLIVRGRDTWEVWLGNREEKVASVYVRGFAVAARCLLLWLRGSEPAQIQSEARGHVMSMPTARRSS